MTFMRSVGAARRCSLPVRVDEPRWRPKMSEPGLLARCCRELARELRSLNQQGFEEVAGMVIPGAVGQ